jgi:hypothetical protein
MLVQCIKPLFEYPEMVLGTNSFAPDQYNVSAGIDRLQYLSFYCPYFFNYFNKNAKEIPFLQVGDELRFEITMYIISLLIEFVPLGCHEML